jgi:hypothetical protein
VRRFPRATLASLREMASQDALALLATHCKADPTFQPVKHVTTRRWHALTARGEFEILTTNQKWYDMRARVGGGGAIDLAMHLLDVTFVEAVKLLTERRSPGG